MTQNGYLALQELYARIKDQGYSALNDEDLLELMEENAELGQSLHLQSIEALAVRKGRRMEGSSYAYRYDNGVAVLQLFGPIFPRANMMTMSGATSIQQFTSDFVAAYNDPDIQAIVMDVDSPGGAVSGIGDAAKLMSAVVAQGKKPVTAFASGYMASAAYYIGSIADKIVGSESSITGSIGVVLTTQSKQGSTVKEIVASQSPNKRPNVDTEKGMAQLQQQVDDLAEIFIKDVGLYRGLSREEVIDNYGAGATMAGPRAKKSGLIDAIGTLSSAVEEAASVPRKKRKLAKSGGKSYSALSVDELMQFRIGDIEDMGLKERIASMFTQGQEEENATAQSGTTATTEESEPAVGAEQGQQPQLTRQDWEERFADSAELFAERMVTDSRIYPAQKHFAMLEMLNAKIDDAVHGGKVSMATDKGELTEGTREQSVSAKYGAMPRHGMTSRLVAGLKKGDADQSVVVLKEHTEEGKGKAEEGPMSEERRLSLLAKSSQGQSVLAQKTS